MTSNVQNALTIKDLKQCGGLMMGSEKPRPLKFFASPFNLVFMTKDEKTTIIEVKSLRGLKEVMRRLNEGEISAQDGFSLELQLWGHLAEHCGFLRAKGSSDGIQPLGEGHAELTEDLSTLFGGEKGMLEALNATKDILSRQGARPGFADNTPSNERLHIKDDGVNLTPAGEKKLAEIVGERGDELQKKQDAGVQLYLETPPAELDVDAEIKASAEEFEGKTITGPEAEEIGKRVEESGKVADETNSGSSQPSEGE